jgi:hypothetical protein
MILFDDVAEAFDLTDLNARRIFGVVAFDRRRVGTAFVDRDFRRRSIRFSLKVPSTARIVIILDNGINRIWFTGRNRKPTLRQNLYPSRTITEKIRVVSSGQAASTHPPCVTRL